MKVKVHWIIDGVMEIDADTNEAAEALADKKLRELYKCSSRIDQKPWRHSYPRSCCHRRG